MSAEGLALAQDKMRAGGVHPVAVEVFSHYYRQLETGATGLMRESEIEPISEPPRLADIEVDAASSEAALRQTAVIKLNGGLRASGTGCRSRWCS